MVYSLTFDLLIIWLKAFISMILSLWRLVRLTAVLQIITPRVSYLISRSITTASALAFAFIYSKALGLNNRSLITFVMTSNSLIWILITSGTTLTLRKLTPSTLDMKKVKSFNSLIALEFAIALVIFLIVIEIYSLFKNYLAVNFIIGSLIYFLLSGFHLIVVEMLIAFNKFRLSGFLDMFTIFLQILFFISLNLVISLSISVRLLVSFSLSYLIISMIGLYYVRKSAEFHFGFENPKLFLRETRGNHSIGFSLGVVDRIDRFLIGATLPTIILGKYAVMSSTISIFRFVPNAISKIVVSKAQFTLHTNLKRKSTIFIAVVVLGAALVTLSQLFIKFWLGSDWLLPISVSICFVFQELLRGSFEIYANRSISLGNSLLVNRLSIQLPFLSIALTFLLVPFIGIIGVPIAFSISFMISLFRFKFRARNE